MRKQKEKERKQEKLEGWLSLCKILKSKGLHTTSVSGLWLLLLCMCLKKEVKGKSNNLLSSGVNQKSHLNPFLVLFTWTFSGLLGIFSFEMEEVKNHSEITVDTLKLWNARRGLWKGSNCEKDVSMLILETCGFLSKQFLAYSLDFFFLFFFSSRLLTSSWTLVIRVSCDQGW